MRTVLHDRPACASRPPHVHISRLLRCATHTQALRNPIILAGARHWSESRDRRAKAKRLLLALAQFPRWLPPWAISFLVTACVLMAGFCGYLCTRAVLDSYDAGEACADKMPPSNHVRQCARPLGPPPPPRDMEFGRAPRKQTSRPPFLAAAQDSDRTVGLDAAQQHSLRGATHLRETV